MKQRITLTMLLLISASGAMARQGGTGGVDRTTVLFFGNAIAILLVIWIASSFLLTMIRLFLSHRLRGALVEKNATEEVIAQILPPKDDLRQRALKYCCLFTAAGFGFTICYFSQPIGLHWAIIMSFALALGLLVFYLISKRFK